jgi:hypothetical protein
VHALARSRRRAAARAEGREALAEGEELHDEINSDSAEC